MISLPVVEASQVGAARRRSVHEAQAVGLGQEEGDRLAIIVTEIATNLLRHAREGEVIIAAEQVDGRAHVTVLGVDVGPGIGNLEAALEDGFTTAEAGDGGIGGGLGAIERLSDMFDIYSDANGTTVTSVVGAPRSGRTPGLDVDGVVVSKPGFEEGGDVFAFRHEEDATLVMLIDVLGHGPAAAEEARRARAAFADGRSSSLPEIHAAVGDALEGRRGAAGLIVKLPREGEVLEAIGLGNVRGEILGRDGERRGIPCAPGIIGATTRPPRPTEHEWRPGAALVLSTDGLRSSQRLGEPIALFDRDPLTIAATLYKRRRRGSDDAGVVVARSDP